MIKQATTICLALSLIFALGCKSKKKADSASSTTTATTTATTDPGMDKPKVTGKVSHQYSECGTVVIITDSNGGAPIILIPQTKLGEFDVDGQEISFHYRPLKMKNPDGCNTGSPAALTDISKK